MWLIDHFILYVANTTTLTLTPGVSKFYRITDEIYNLLLYCVLLLMLCFYRGLMNTTVLLAAIS